MHELAVCQSLIDEVQRVAKEQDATRVAHIVVRCGALSGVEPRLLHRAFLIARAGTIASEATLAVEPEPVVVLCETCEAERTVSPNRLVCPECGRSCPRLVSGDSLLLLSIALDREETTTSEPRQAGGGYHV